MSDWRAEEVVNETIFREMNEWTRESDDAHPAAREQQVIYLCECSDRRCTDPISLTDAEYEAVRAVPVRFAIALNHENPEIDRVVVENPRFATVDKFSGMGAKIAWERDPRRAV